MKYERISILEPNCSTYFKVFNPLAFFRQAPYNLKAVNSHTVICFFSIIFFFNFR